MLGKSINSGKEHRKIYYGAKQFDRSCRNHGSCSWCRNSRLRKRLIADISAKEQTDEEVRDKTTVLRRTIKVRTKRQMRKFR